jgi:hypothetical protein
MRFRFIGRYVALGVLACLPLLAQTNPLVGTWERTSLLKDGAAQPSPAPQVILFGPNGYFLQSELPIDRAKTFNPQEKMTDAERFEHVTAARGTYTVSGDTVSRNHVVDLDPNLDGYNEVRQFRIENGTLILQGSTPEGSKIEARFHKLPPMDVKPSPVIGTWERVWLIRDGVLQQPPSVPEYVFFGGDGYFMQMELPAGRPKVQKPLAKMTPEELKARFAHVAVAFGTYSIAASIVTRKHLRTDTPSSEGYEHVRGFRFEGGFLRMRGPNANATEADAWFQSVK